MQDRGDVEPKEVYNFRPEINPTSRKIVELRSINLEQTQYGNMTLNTELTHGVKKKQEKMAQYETENQDDFDFRPKINEHSLNMDRGLNDIMEDTNRKLA
jgi:hypothetical protein